MLDVMKLRRRQRRSARPTQDWVTDASNLKERASCAFNLRKARCDVQSWIVREHS